MSFNKKFFATGGIVASSEAVCNTDSKYAFGADSNFTSNVATYQLDGNANDTTGNYNGTASNVTFSSTDARFGQAASFNGTSSEITTNLDIPHTSDFSVSFWVKIDTFGNDVICTDGDFDTNAELGFGFQAVTTGSKIIFYVASNSNLVNAQISSLSTGTWYHVVGVCDLTNNIKLYINGNLEQTSPYTYASRNDRSTFRIGRDHSMGGRFFPGDLDQIRIFDRPITASEVATLYAETSATASSINPLNEGQGVALYNLDYDASDAGDLYPGTPTDVTFGVGGQINYGARFNGSSSVITLPALPITTSSDVTFSAWIKGSSDATDATIVSTLSENGLEFRVQNSAVKAVYRKSGSWSASSSVSVTADAWNHVVLTYEQGVGFNIYVNNNTPTTFAETGTLSNIGSSNTIGKYANGSSGYFDGDIDQVRIFSSVLTDAQVSTLYEETACVYTATANTADFPSTATAVAHYPLDNSAEDNKGTNDGTETNIEYRFGRYGQAAVFNGSSSYISIPATNTTPIDFSSESHTFSVWVNVDNISGDKAIISKWHNTTASLRSTIFYISGGNIKILEGGSADNTHTSTGTISANTWTHIVYTRAATESKIYINGSLDSTHSRTATIRQGGTENIFIGFQRGGFKYFDGQIDQVRVYSTVLDSDEVSQLYNEKPETDTSNFKTVLWNGNNDYISNVGIDLETYGGLFWSKARDNTYHHGLIDSVRGVNNIIYSSLTNSQATTTDQALSFEANGVILGANSDSQNSFVSGEDYVGWFWKGAGDEVNIAVNSITGSTPSIASDVSANTEAGFSIVRHTGTSTVGTIAHGLNQAPEFIMTKSSSHDTGDGFTVYADGLAQSSSYLNMVSQNIPNPNSVVWTTNAPTTDIFYVGTATGTNSSGKTYISYCWHSVSGYSKIGTYEGGTGDVTVSDVGFKPSFVMIKNVDDSSDWVMLDNRRNTIDDRLNNWLRANSNAIETGEVGSAYITVNDNGFVVNSTTSFGTNNNGDTYLYMAFK